MAEPRRASRLAAADRRHAGWEALAKPRRAGRLPAAEPRRAGHLPEPRRAGFEAQAKPRRACRLAAFGIRPCPAAHGSPPLRRATSWHRGRQIRPRARV
jgi:hypothetical protein